MERARRGEFTRHSEAQKRHLVNRYERLLEQAKVPQPNRNRLKGDFDERLRTPPSIRQRGQAQPEYLAGGRRLPGQTRKGTARPEYSKPRRGGGRGHVNLKSDRIHRLSESQAVSRARRYTNDAVRNARALPTGDRVILRYVNSPSPEIQRAMNAQHFRPGSPIGEVHYGTRVYRNPNL